MPNPNALPDLDVRTIEGTTQSLAAYRGRVRLVVNVASACGYTPQYAGLERLYRKYRDAGFVVLGFPCNQFGGQEPGGSDEIAAFCRGQYHVTFPLFAKVNVNGPAAHPLFVYLKNARRGLLGTKAIKWNFTKFLVNKDGVVLARYGPRMPPEKIESEIARLLERK